MAEAAERLTALQARDAAFEQFRAFFDGDAVKNVLLEGIRLGENESVWVVEIGFDAGRVRMTKDGFAGAIGYLTADKVVDPIREIRAFHIDASDGSLVRIERR